MEKGNEYELVFIAHPDLDEEGVTSITEKAQSWIDAAGGEVTYTDLWGRRKLAYPVRKQTEGSYVLLRALLPPQAITELERELKLMDGILRHLVVRAETPLPPSEPLTMPEVAVATEPSVEPNLLPEEE